MSVNAQDLLSGASPMVGDRRVSAATQAPASTGKNPVRGQLWVLGAEVAAVAFLAILADAGYTEISVILLFGLWLMFLILHADEVKQVLNTLGAGGTNA